MIPNSKSRKWWNITTIIFTIIADIVLVHQTVEAWSLYEKADKALQQAKEQLSEDSNQ